jgi:Ribosomal protein L7/L12 C-terminal domain
MIPEAHKDEIINSGITFMRSITEAYGSDEGMKLWDAIASTLDPDVKGQIFFTLLVGDYRGEIRLRGMTPVQTQNVNKVAVIKQIREVTNNGLKEAKDLADAMWGGADIRLPVTESGKRGQYIIEFRKLGCNV